MLRRCVVTVLMEMFNTSEISLLDSPFAMHMMISFSLWLRMSVFSSSLSLDFYTAKVIIVARCANFYGFLALFPVIPGPDRPSPPSSPAPTGDLSCDLLETKFRPSAEATSGAKKGIVSYSLKTLQAFFVPKQNLRNTCQATSREICQPSRMLRRTTL